MCQDDVAQLGRQPGQGSSAAGRPVAGGGRGHGLHRHPGVSFSSQASTAGEAEH